MDGSLHIRDGSWAIAQNEAYRALIPELGLKPPHKGLKGTFPPLLIVIGGDLVL
jgi:hypothetical protein